MGICHRARIRWRSPRSPFPKVAASLYPNILVEDAAHTINRRWAGCFGQEAILVPDFNTKCQCRIYGKVLAFYRNMTREAVENGLLVTRRINNPRQDSRMLLATQHAATGVITGSNNSLAQKAC